MSFIKPRPPLPPTLGFPTLQARTAVRSMDVVLLCNTQRVAGLIYDAISLNARGPGAVPVLNFPEEVPAEVYASLGLTPSNRGDALNRYLLHCQLQSEGAAGTDLTAIGNLGAAAAAAAMALPAAATPFDSAVDAEQEQALLRHGAAQARARIAAAVAAEEPPLLGIEVKVSRLRRCPCGHRCCRCCYGWRLCT